MTRIQFLLVTMFAAAPAALGGLALAAQDRYSLQVPGGLAFGDFRGYEDWQVVAVSHNGDKLATILGNPAMIEAYRAGIPGNGKPFPDGARSRRSIGPRGQAEDQPGPPIVPGALHDIDFMVKDSKKFADSGGWGYAQFEYDTASETLQARRRHGYAAAGARRQMRVRLPHDRGRQGLRLHGLSEAVRRLARLQRSILRWPREARRLEGRGAANRR